MKRSLKVRFLLLLVLAVLTLVVPAIQTAQPGVCAAGARQWGTCSGDDCGCGVETQECIAACNGNLACVRQCRCDGLNCSRVCCGAPPKSCL